MNGLNLYCYCINNPIMYADPSGHEPFTIFMIVLLTSLISATLLAVESPNAERTGLSVEEPTFFSASENELSIISSEVNIGKKTWYLDENKTSSFYYQGASIELSIGIPYNIKKEKKFFDINLYLCKFGYDGRYLDVGIPFGLDPEFISIDFVHIYKNIKSLFD